MVSFCCQDTAMKWVREEPQSPPHKKEGQGSAERTVQAHLDPGPSQVPTGRTIEVKGLPTLPAFC